MALTRKFLSALGIEADKIDEIIEAHVETTNSLKAERDEFKANAEKLESVQKELNDAKKSLENAGSDAFKVKYDAIKEEFEAYKTEQTKKEVAKAKDTAYRTLLKDAGVSEKRIDSIMKVTKLDDIEIDEKGTIKDADTLKTSIAEEWADFLTTESKEGAGTQTPPKDEENHTPVAIPSIF